MNVELVLFTCFLKVPFRFFQFEVKTLNDSPSLLSNLSCYKEVMMIFLKFLLSFMMVKVINGTAKLEYVRRQLTTLQLSCHS